MMNETIVIYLTQIKRLNLDIKTESLICPSFTIKLSTIANFNKEERRISRTNVRID